MTENQDRLTGPVQRKVESKLTEFFKPDHLEVINESYMHNVPKGTESHFKVIVVSEKFDKLTSIKRHRLVHEAIDEEIKNDIHALSIVAKTPEQWQASDSVIKSPPCMGGSKK